MKHSHKMLPVLCLLTLASCGGGGGGGSSKSGSNQQREEMQSADGIYKAILRPYNFSLNGWVPNGMTDIKVDGVNIEIKSWLDDSAAVTHMQNIHIGTRCPTPEDDRNGDGYVDFNETLNVSGKILIPLDSNIASQSAGANVFPKGNFTYYQKALLDDVVNDLQEPDTNTADNLIKIGASEGLDLGGRVIIVMGTTNKTLPNSVSTVNGMTKELSVPIACGVIEKKSEVN